MRSRDETFARSPRRDPRANGRTRCAVEPGPGSVLAFETLNLADGRRSVSEIRDVLTGRYEPVPLAEVTGHFDLLAKARVVTFR